MTSQEDEFTGKGAHRKTNSQEDELGTAQPQLVFQVLLTEKYSTTKSGLLGPTKGNLVY